jgi:SlyX protein
MDQAPTPPSKEELIRQDERISELESRLEFQDETIQKLNDEMVQLQGKLFAQDKQLKRLMDRPQAAAGDEDGADPNQVEPPPPHY